MKKRLFAAAFLVAAIPTIASSQDPFEIQVYEYITVPKGKWNLETHLNRVAKGEMKGENHLTFELTRGITDYVEMAAYIVTGTRPAGGTRSVAGGDWVSWRLRPRFRVPENKLPFRFSLSTEVAFPVAYGDVTLEIRPILEWQWGKTLLDINPVIGKALTGPDSDEALDFEPGVRLGYTLNPKVDLSMEYYGGLGEITNPAPSAQQVHQFFPGADFQLKENIVWNVGIGFGATDAGNTLVYKMRLGWMW
jgi:hypothetical protein